MPVTSDLDYYEVLQVSPNADEETITRVYRYLAKRLHPDNPETGDAERFTTVTDAFRTLSDPERRAEYDQRYEGIRERQWQILDEASAGDPVESDRRVRFGILSLLYSTRRRDTDDPGMGVYELERLIGTPEEHMKFHIWYLKQNAWIERLDNGQYAITAAGVDRVTESEVSWRSKGPLMISQGGAEPEPEPEMRDSEVSNG